MRIHFLVNPVFNGWSPTDKRLGGTEESVVRWSEELVGRGHAVTVFMNHRDPSAVTFSRHGVTYTERGLFDEQCDVVVNIKSSDVMPHHKPTLYLTNEVDADKLDLSKYAGVILPSKWAVDNIPVNNKTFIVPHGYDETRIYPKQKVPKQCLYASSPDRGLQTLALIWPSIVEQHPDAHLYVAYGGSIDTPNTTCGEFSEEEMDELFNTSEFWLHPCSGGELFGISGIKAQAAQATPVYFPTMALSETVQSGISCTDTRDMYNTLCALLGDDDKKEALRMDMENLYLPTWEKSTDVLESVMMQAWKK